MRPEPVHDARRAGWARRHTDGRATGFSLVEVMVALAVIVVGVLGFVSATTTASKLQRQTQQYGRASRAIQSVHEILRSGDLDGRVAAYKAAPTFADDTIEVQVQFPAEILEEALGAAIPAGWRYRDTDADGEVDLDPTATAAASIVPVRVLARWNEGELRSTFLVVQ